MSINISTMQLLNGLTTFINSGFAGFEINARPLARGDWKQRGMSRIFAQVAHRASGYFNFFCQLSVTMNETNY